MTDYIADLQHALRDAAAREYAAQTSSPEPAEHVIAENAQTTRRRRPLASGYASRRKGGRRAARRFAPVLTLAAVFAAAVVVLTGGSSPSILSGAYAATGTDGVIVHYVETLHFQNSTGTSQGALHDVWASGQQRHVIVTTTDPKRTEEVAFNGTTEENYLPDGTLATYRVAAGTLARGCGSVGILLGECGRGDQINPLIALRRLYRSGRLRAAGQAALDGRRVEVITGVSQGIRLRALVDPHTFVPVEIQLVQHFAPPAAEFPALKLTTTITDYQRLPLTPHNRQLLLMRPHPHARRLHLCVNGTGCAKSPTR
jgi:hypothetical protein